MLSPALRRIIFSAAPQTTGATFRGYASSAVSGTSFNFPSLFIGASSSNRLVVVCVVCASNVNVTTMTIGGVAAVAATSALSSNAGGGSPRSDIWYATVPFGTFATIAITTSGSTTAIGIGLHTLQGPNVAFSVAAHNQTSGATVGLNVGCNVPAGGVIIGGGGVLTSTISPIGGAPNWFLGGVPQTSNAVGGANCLVVGTMTVGAQFSYLTGVSSLKR